MSEQTLKIIPDMTGIYKQVQKFAAIRQQYELLWSTIYNLHI